MSTSASAPGIRIPQSSVAVIDRYGGEIGKKALLAAGVAQVFLPTAAWAWKKFRTREQYTVVIGGMDDIYPEVHAWVLERMPADKKKALILDTQRWKPNMRLRFDGSRTQEVEIEGHKAVVWVATEQLPVGREALPENWRRLAEKIIFSVGSIEAREAVLRMLSGLITKVYPIDQRPPLLIPSRWGSGWQERMDLKPRTLESVILKDGQLEGLVNDLQHFLDAENDYDRLGQPWHRGYLFHGPPGTGKTSLARALANHFGLSVYYLPLGDIEKDTNLLQYISQIDGKSMLLIEDVDVYHATTERKESKEHSSLAAMLNALDGIWTPHGLITVLTTNRKEALDTALIRAGRIDVTEELTDLDLDQAIRLADFVGLQSSPHNWVDKTPAEMIAEAREDQLDVDRRRESKALPDARPMAERDRGLAHASGNDRDYVG